MDLGYLILCFPLLGGLIGAAIAHSWHRGWMQGSRENHEITTSVNLLDVEIALLADDAFARMSDDDLRGVVIALKEELAKRGWTLHCTKIVTDDPPAR